MAVDFATVSFEDPTAQRLVFEQRAELLGRYEGRDGSGEAPREHEFRAPLGTFLLATLDGVPVGCGGLCRFDAGTAEIRRMYVTPGARGAGIGSAMLEALLGAAKELEYARVRLETARKQPEAIRLYERAGFAPIPCWGPYASDERSVCLELVL